MDLLEGHTVVAVGAEPRAPSRLGKHAPAAVKAVVTSKEKLRGRLLGRLRD